ncbi:LysE family translocator [Kordiimonas lacus]|uniref:Threonine/homoserine/homoserine lactone efflux protein n=1 Tax=Kordiimonas lacus TaxID=637679 RepID=A0A1G7CSA3_9PROT|nr:LysE family translocator [Kordiimonas lacus]SDE41526.1 Threonine/homoserine/homoserine lactone efflux protein [Kordiimonas lacus]
MDLVTIITFMSVLALLVISPGPNGVLIAKTVPTSGRKAGFANIIGFIAAFYLHGTLSIFGISILLVRSAEAFFIFKMAGAAYLCWVGVKALWSTWKTSQDTNTAVTKAAKRTASLRGACLEGFLTNALNPKVSMFYLAAFPQFLTVGDSPFQAYALVSAHVALNSLWFSAMILVLARFKTMATSARFSKWLKSLTGVVFIGFGTKLALLRQ